MIIKELIIKLLELPIDATIGIATYNENEELYGDPTIYIESKQKVKIIDGEKDLYFYIR